MSEGGSWLDTALGWAGIGADAAEVGHTAHHITHALHEGTHMLPSLRSTSDLAISGAAQSGGLGLANWLGPVALAAGVNNMMHADGSAEGIIHGAEGALQATSGAIGTTGLIGAGLNAVGATGAGGAMVSGAAAAAPVAAVAGAGALGLAAGTGMYHASDSEYTRTGFWGQDDSGRNRSAADWGSNWGNRVDAAIGTRPGDWSIPGAAASMAGGIVGGVAGTAQAAWNYLSDERLKTAIAPIAGALDLLARF